MSTRGAIARLTSKAGKAIKFKGNFHHWDSYTSALGSTLFQLRNGHFKGDTNAMLKVLIEDHPAGWSTIIDKDWKFAPAFIEQDGDNYKTEIYKKTPMCYCHGSRSETANPINEKNASDRGCEYIYAFNKEGNIMVVLSSYTADGSKMIGMFGCGDPDATWKVIGEIDLDGKEPDWDKPLPMFERDTNAKRATKKEIEKDFGKKVLA